MPIVDPPPWSADDPRRSDLRAFPSQDYLRELQWREREDRPDAKDIFEIVHRTWSITVEHMQVLKKILAVLEAENVEKEFLRLRCQELERMLNPAVCVEAPNPEPQD
jgi:hypothetical protein